MKLGTFACDGASAIGVVAGERILDLAAAWRKFRSDAPPPHILALIGSEDAVSDVKKVVSAVAREDDPRLWRARSEVRLQAPVSHLRKNVFCVGRNYRLHIEEGARARGQEPTYPTVPEFFSKPPTAVVGDGESIRLDPNVTQQLDYEVELAIVIGRTVRDIGPSQAADAIFGYTIVNDISARDLQFKHGQWFKGKSLDTSCPMGPWIVTKDEFGDPAARRISLRVNGETRQDSSISDMLFDCAAIVASLSQGLTLEPGDVIATGTPSGVALGMSPPKWLRDADVIEAEVEGIGVLRNQVRAVA